MADEIPYIAQPAGEIPFRVIRGTGTVIVPRPRLQEGHLLCKSDTVSADHKCQHRTDNNYDFHIGENSRKRGINQIFRPLVRIFHELQPYPVIERVTFRSKLLRNSRHGSDWGIFMQFDAVDTGLLRSDV